MQRYRCTATWRSGAPFKKPGTQIQRACEAGGQSKAPGGAGRSLGITIKKRSEPVKRVAERLETSVAALRGLKSFHEDNPQAALRSAWGFYSAASFAG